MYCEVCAFPRPFIGGQDERPGTGPFRCPLSHSGDCPFLADGLDCDEDFPF